ncbi:DUF948 domain-containing protein [Bacillus canaveralius]|uniref:DUF948 domain-containing protein n=1 Tax=Bacillus canaveralius TaxID=1403243 RepID=UPI000F7B634C|nr:DUF948 domain-containing protein [Bacillus canaveralius]RSK56455.1 DUF948 domain-containing protein [Bacillus canaveralius]
MIIVYLSIALVVGSLIYLGYSAFTTLKEAKPAINNLSQSATRVQQQTESIRTEKDELTANQQQLIADIQQKKAAVNSAIKAVKETTQSFKKLVKIKPIAHLQRKDREQLLKWEIRKRSFKSQY